MYYIGILILILSIGIHYTVSDHFVVDQMSDLRANEYNAFKRSCRIKIPYKKNDATRKQIYVGEIQKRPCIILKIKTVYTKYKQYKVHYLDSEDDFDYMISSLVNYGIRDKKNRAKLVKSGMKCKKKISKQLKAIE